MQELAYSTVQPTLTQLTQAANGHAYFVFSFSFLPFFMRSPLYFVEAYVRTYFILLAVKFIFGFLLAHGSFCFRALGLFFVGSSFYVLGPYVNMLRFSFICLDLLGPHFIVLWAPWGRGDFSINFGVIWTLGPRSACFWPLGASFTFGVILFCLGPPSWTSFHFVLGPWDVFWMPIFFFCFLSGGGGFVVDWQ